MVHSLPPNATDQQETAGAQLRTELSSLEPAAFQDQLKLLTAKLSEHLHACKLLFPHQTCLELMPLNATPMVHTAPFKPVDQQDTHGASMNKEFDSRDLRKHQDQF
jgi:hypothetical protein